MRRLRRERVESGVGFGQPSVSRWLPCGRRIWDRAKVGSVPGQERLLGRSAMAVLLRVVESKAAGRWRSAVGNDPIFITDVQSNSTFYQFGTICSPGEEAFSGQVGANGSLSLSFSDPLDSYTGTGQVVSTSSVSGTYKGSTANDCPYFGSFTETSVPPLAGTFS